MRCKAIIGQLSTLGSSTTRLWGIAWSWHSYAMKKMSPLRNNLTRKMLSFSDSLLIKSKSKSRWKDKPSATYRIRIASSWSSTNSWTSRSQTWITNRWSKTTASNMGPKVWRVTKSKSLLAQKDGNRSRPWKLRFFKTLTRRKKRTSSSKIPANSLIKV